MLISKLKFGSYLTYCPRSDNGEHHVKITQSQNIMRLLKNERSIGVPPKFMSDFIAMKIKENLSSLTFRDFFGDDVALVPIPKSSLMQKDSLWVPDKLAKALASQGLGIHYPCLERFKVVPKASYSVSSDRPKPMVHIDSIKIKSLVVQPQKFVLIDDVVTRGSTMIGCANVIKERFPDAIILGFAAIRTISASEEFVSISAPIVGEITLLPNNETLRRP